MWMGGNWLASIALPNDGYQCRARAAAYGRQYTLSERAQNRPPKNGGRWSMSAIRGHWWTGAFGQKRTLNKTSMGLINLVVGRYEDRQRLQ
jgi:hypothetical protein